MPALRTRDTQSRSLEVTTDAPAPPALSIVSPTPRAFTFPINHNLSDSPYSSPSSSPFEPDRDPLQFTNPFPSASNAGLAPIQIPTPPPPFPPPPYSRGRPLTDRPVTPDSLRSASPTPSHKRRKSSASSEASERRPKKGDEDYVKRPENAFILFRRKCCEDRQQAAEEAAQLADGPQKKQRQADLSKTISQQWKSLSAEEKQYWENLAKEKKKEHEQLYPNYVYRPQRQKDKDGRSKNKKSSKSRGREDERDEPSVSFVVPVARFQGRSASLPTPPPYQSIRIPQVYHLTPSAPNSPSLIPMITRQSSTSIDSSNNFDFVPTHSYVPPPFPHSASLDASIRGMFPAPGQQARKPGPSPLAQLALQMQQDSAMFQESRSMSLPALPPLDIVSPGSSVSSGSSGPSSPSNGPFTPNSAPLDPNAFLASHNLDLFEFNGGLQSQADLDLQAEMQMQNDFTQFTWDWPGSAPAILDNNWDINSIPTAMLGEQPLGVPMAKFSSSDLPSTGLDFGQDFTQALESGFHETPMLGGYDDLMAGNAFAAAA